MRHGQTFALVLCDLDGFKLLNDQEGHLVGDEQLVRFAGHLTKSVRRTDYAYRIGGDEFALLLVTATAAEAKLVIERIRTGLIVDGTVSASFGVAVYADQASPNDLFRMADEAMYSAKRSGGCVAVAA